MKVVAINGSPNSDGNTYTALNIIKEELQKENIETEIITIGRNKITGCTGCGTCRKLQNMECITKDDGVNEIIKKMSEADGIILGSPVYYAGINGSMKSFLDRAFYTAGSNGSLFKHKVGASVVAVRRSGGVSTFEELNNYLLYSQMLIPTSNYWNVIHGRAKGEVLQDLEGVQIMEVLARNFAYALKLIEHGKGIIEPPEPVNKVMTNFIR